MPSSAAAPPGERAAATPRRHRYVCRCSRACGAARPRAAAPADRQPHRRVLCAHCLASALAALLFGVHAVHVESVANVVGRAELLSAGVFRGQGIGIAKAIVSLTLFHEGRIYLTNQFKAYNLKKLD